MIKIIQHRIKPVEPEELAHKFICKCGCEFWSDTDGMMELRSFGRVLLYQIKCPECGGTADSLPNSQFCEAPKSKIFGE